MRISHKDIPLTIVDGFYPIPGAFDKPGTGMTLVLLDGKMIRDMIYALDTDEGWIDIYDPEELRKVYGELGVPMEPMTDEQQENFKRIRLTGVVKIAFMVDFDQGHLASLKSSVFSIDQKLTRDAEDFKKAIDVVLKEEFEEASRLKPMSPEFRKAWVEMNDLVEAFFKKRTAAGLPGPKDAAEFKDLLEADPEIKVKRDALEEIRKREKVSEPS